VSCRERKRKSRYPCIAHPFGLSVHKQDGLVHFRIGGDFDRAAVGRMGFVLAGLRGGHLERVVFDLGGVTFMDGAALRVILAADQSARREGFEVVVVRPPRTACRIFTLTRAGEHLAMVSNARQAGIDEHPRDPLRFRRLVPGELPTCIRCRSNPAIWEAGQLAGGPVTLESADGPLCHGCITTAERIELGEALLRNLREGEPAPEAQIRALEKALTELRESEPHSTEGLPRAGDNAAGR
jgi:anti-anti-sigma factor